MPCTGTDMPTQRTWGLVHERAKLAAPLPLPQPAEDEISKRRAFHCAQTGFRRDLGGRARQGLEFGESRQGS
jgi:hypothetical protein